MRVEQLKQRYAQLENRLAFRWSSLDVAELEAIKSELYAARQIA